MEKYVLKKQVGAGAYGSVWKALDKQSKEVVAIKKLKRKYHSWEQCKNLREIKSLSRMNHPNIVKLKEVIKEYDSLFFVFEYMQGNLHQLIEQRNTFFSETEVRNVCFQVLLGLHYMHQNGYFHRDLKPENLLVSGNVVKIADFGMVRETNSDPPYTQNVTTLWYRAPEVILQSFYYGFRVDMWAMGAIMAELMTLNPLFPGTSEVDQMYKICSVLGTPTMESWPYGVLLARTNRFKLPELPGVNFSRLIPSASEDAISLISSLCSWDPCKRPTAAEALQHPFFTNSIRVPASVLGGPPAFPATPIRLEVDQVSDADELLANIAVGPRKQGKILANISIGPRKLSKTLANVAIGPRKQCVGHLKPNRLVNQKTNLFAECT